MDVNRIPVSESGPRSPRQGSASPPARAPSVRRRRRLPSREPRQHHQRNPGPASSSTFLPGGGSRSSGNLRDHGTVRPTSRHRMMKRFHRKTTGGANRGSGPPPPGPHGPCWRWSASEDAESAAMGLSRSAEMRLRAGGDIPSMSPGSPTSAAPSARPRRATKRSVRSVWLLDYAIAALSNKMPNRSPARDETGTPLAVRPADPSCLCTYRTQLTPLQSTARHDRWPAWLRYVACVVSNDCNAC